MITPEYLQEIMDAVEEKLVDVDVYILRRIIKRIVATFENSGKILIPSTKNDIRKLLQTGVLYEDIRDALSKAMPEIEGEIRSAFYDAAGEIIAQNNDIATQIIKLEKLASVSVPEYEQVGITKNAAELGLTKVEVRKLEAVYKRTVGEMHNLTKTAPQMAVNNYIDACDKAYMKVMSGVSAQTAIVDAIKECADRGSEIKYKGHTDKIEVAIARAVRTGVNQASGDIVLTRCAEMGIPYVKASSHMGARVTKNNDFTNHGYWQGRVYWLDWKNTKLEGFQKDASATGSGFEWLQKMREELQNIDGSNKYGYPDFVTSCGFGDIRGIFGVNCRHSVYAFYPGIQTNDDDRPNLEENEKRYRIDQKQRAMERAIRQTKRELEALKASGLDTPEAKAEIKAVRAKLRQQSDEYMKFCSENGTKPRNQSLKIN